MTPKTREIVENILKDIEKTKEEGCKVAFKKNLINLRVM